MTNTVNADLIDGITQAITMLDQHVESYMDDDGIPDAPDPERSSLEGISHHLKGTVEQARSEQAAINQSDISDGWWWIRGADGCHCIVAVEDRLVFFTGDEVASELSKVVRDYVFVSMIPEPV